MASKSYANPLHGPGNTAARKYEAHTIVGRGGGGGGVDATSVARNPFLDWSVHELQELLVASASTKDIRKKVMHMHLKRQLAQLALELCKAKFAGIVPPKPTGHRESVHVHSDTKFVKRSSHAYAAARGLQAQRQARLRSQARGHAYLHKHADARFIGYGPDSGSTSRHAPILRRNRRGGGGDSDSDSGPESDEEDPNTRRQRYRRGTVTRIAQQRAMQMGGAPPPPPPAPSSSSSSSSPSSQANARSRARATSISTTRVVGGRWQAPSRLKALAFAVEHSPRDWARFEREQDELDDIKELRAALQAMDEAASLVVKREAAAAVAKSKKHKLSAEEKERKLLAIKLNRLERKPLYEGPVGVEILEEMDKDGIYAHAYQVPKYQCCSAPLGRHCPYLVCHCSRNRCVGKRGCRCNLCERYCDPCGEGSQGTFMHHGVGLSLYFKFLKWLGFTSFFMFLVVLPEVLINTFGVNKGAMLQDNSLPSLSLGNLGELNTTIAVPCWTRIFTSVTSQDSVDVFCEVDRSAIAHLYARLDCVAMGLFFLSFLWLRHSEHAEGAHFDELSSVSSVADYTLLITSFPEDIMVKSPEPEKIVEEERYAEAWLMQVRAVSSVMVWRAAARKGLCFVVVVVVCLWHFRLTDRLLFFLSVFLSVFLSFFVLLRVPHLRVRASSSKVRSGPPARNRSAKTTTRQCSSTISWTSPSASCTLSSWPRTSMSRSISSARWPRCARRSTSWSGASKSSRRTKELPYTRATLPTPSISGETSVNAKSNAKSSWPRCRGCSANTAKKGFGSEKFPKSSLPL